MEQIIVSKQKESGQAVTEYVLLLAIIVSLYTMILGKISDSSAFADLKKPLEKDYVYTYRYGHPQARGQEDGGPKYIPQYNKQGDSQNFRIFINPPIND
jgi:hypothetical protein